MENPNIGEPTSKRSYIKNGFTFEESIWENEFGKVVKLELVDTPLNIPNEKETSLEDKLELAIKDERYEDAAKLRDMIKNKTISDDVFDSEDNWNF